MTLEQKRDKALERLHDYRFKESNVFRLRSYSQHIKRALRTVLKYDNQLKISMDLISAKVEAAKRSRTEKKKMYINVDSEGECTVASKPDEPITVYSNGSEVALDSDIKVSTATNVKTKKQKVMAETAKKKTAAKKVVAAKSERPSNQVGKATTLFLTEAQWKKFAEKGNIRDNVQKAVIKTFGL